MGGSALSRKIEQKVEGRREKEKAEGKGQEAEGKELY
jgi:hypothetical protein